MPTKDVVPPWMSTAYARQRPPADTAAGQRRRGRDDPIVSLARKTTASWSRSPGERGVSAWRGQRQKGRWRRLSPSGRGFVTDITEPTRCAGAGHRYAPGLRRLGTAHSLPGVSPLGLPVDATNNASVAPGGPQGASVPPALTGVICVEGVQRTAIEARGGRVCH